MQAADWQVVVLATCNARRNDLTLRSRDMSPLSSLLACNSADTR